MACAKVGLHRKTAMRLAAEHRRKNFSNMTHYQCSKCYHKEKSYHLTSQIRRRGARRVKR